MKNRKKFCPAAESLQKTIDTRMAKWYDIFSQFNIPVRGADFKSKLREVPGT